MATKPTVGCYAGMKTFLIGLAAILPAWSTADAQENRDIRVRVGVGAQLRPKFTGADKTTLAPLFHVNIARGTDESRIKTECGEKLEKGPRDEAHAVDGGGGRR